MTRNILTLTIATALLFAAPASVLAQAAPASLLGADGKPLTFAVVSIREDKSEPTRENPPKMGPTPDGYRLYGPPLSMVIRAAFSPSQGATPLDTTGVPAWLNSTHYVIDAKVSEADMPRWKDPAQQPAMLRAMLQAMLADRFKLIVHRESKEVSIYEMTLAKSGPKFKPSAETALADIRQNHPDAANMIALNNAIVATGANREQQLIYGVTMPDFANFLSRVVGRPVQDKTGITGRYDIAYRQPPPPPEEGAAPDLSSEMFSVVEDQLGLQLKSAKGSVETLVIDHIEQPSEN
jgi:uncharacterized protein (TIGR03435 family)